MRVGCLELSPVRDWHTGAEPLAAPPPMLLPTGFTNYTRSPAGDIFNPEHRRVHQDMTQPLSHYFITSSHNTYLAGDQLTSQSRADMWGAGRLELGSAWGRWQCARKGMKDKALFKEKCRLVNGDLNARGQRLP